MHRTCSSILAKVLLWRPNAGFGDSLLAMVGALQIAMQTGRAFFVDWESPAPLELGLFGPRRYPYKPLIHRMPNPALHVPALCELLLQRTHARSFFLGMQ